MLEIGVFEKGFPARDCTGRAGQRQRDTGTETDKHNDRTKNINVQPCFP
jgi:hypothetical protein